MGHYAADFQCSRCGQLRCTCPPPKDVTADHWLVADDFTPMRVRDFDRQYRQHALLHRLGRKLFEQRKDAEAHAIELMEKAVAETAAAISKLEQRLAELKGRLAAEQRT